MEDKIDELAKKVMLNYYVVFKSNYRELDYQPTLRINQRDTDMYYGTTMHMFDKELKNVLLAFEYILHLPRIGFDVQDLDVDTIQQAYDEPHNIIPIPAWIAESLGKGLPEHLKPTLIIYEDECEKSAKVLQNLYNPYLGSTSISELSSELLRRHWTAIGAMMEGMSDELCIPTRFIRLIDGKEQKVLSLLFLANQFKLVDGTLEYILKNGITFEKYFRGSIYLHAYLNSRVALQESGITDQEEIDKSYNEIFRTNLEKINIPIVITMPGISTHQMEYLSMSNTLSNTEKEVIRLVGTHRAIAKSGVLVELDIVPAELFEELNNLEEHCRQGKIDNKFVWSSLNKMGRILNKHIGREKILAIERASHITIFSDFPMALAIFPDTSEPLCCIKPISYRTLTPLTKTLQYEFLKQNQLYLGKKCKIIIAECLDKEDYIGQYSEGAWNVLKEMCEKYDGMDIVYYDISSIEHLKSVLNEHKNADILLISAHGIYNKEANMTGLCIGNKVWMADDKDLKVPPVVLLSACNVSPRGSGAVSAADLFMRAGAMTVLGTFISIDARRNALLMGRLFVYIQEAQKGSNQLRTLDEAWNFVVASNAVNEILEASPDLKSWAMAKRKDGTIPIYEFQQKKSVGRLRRGYVYKDTIKILREMAEEDNMEQDLDFVLKEYGYFPESIFYQMIGYPENVFLYNPVFEQFYKPNE